MSIPTAPVGPAPTLSPTPPPRTPGVVIAAVVVAGTAFLLGLAPILGLILGVMGLVLGIVAVRRPRGKALGVIAIVAAGLALVTSAVTTVIVFSALPSLLESARFASTPIAVETPCYTFQGPAGHINNQSDAEDEQCLTRLQLWGETDSAGNVINTGVGAIYGQVSVEPIRTELVESWQVGTDLADVVDYLDSAYFASLGTVDSLHEAVRLDGAEANVTRVTSSSSLTQTKAAIVAFSPSEYSIGFSGKDETVTFWIVVVVTPYDDGDEIINTVLETWEWR